MTIQDRIIIHINNMLSRSFQFDKQDIMFVKCSDDGITEEFGYEKEQLPLLVYFENQIPIEYDGKLTDEREDQETNEDAAREEKSSHRG